MMEANSGVPADRSGQHGRQSQPVDGDAHGQGTVTVNDVRPDSDASHSTAEPQPRQHHDQQMSSGSDSPAPSTKTSKWRSALPDWIVDNLTQPRSWRIWFRCWVAAWAGLVLMIPQPSLNVLGQAAFFACMVVFMLPPAYPLVVSILLYTTLALGACLGWAWGVAAMAAANAARDQTVNQQRLLIAQQSIAGTTNPEAQYSALIFRGNFLDTKSSAVHGVFIVVLAYLAGIVQVKMPKLKISVIFCLILADIFASYGPLFPFPRYTLGTTFMIPLSCGVAIALATQILIFPETLHYAWQLQLLKLLGLNVKLLASHQAALEKCGAVDDAASKGGSDGADLDTFKRLAKEGEEQIASIARQHQDGVRQMHLGMIGLAGALADQGSMLELEATYSRLSGKDLRTFVAPLRKLAVRMMSLNAFWKHLSDESGIHADGRYRTEDHDDFVGAEERRESDFDEKHHLRPTRQHESQTLRRMRRKVLEAEAEQQISLVSLVRILGRATAAPVAANKRALSSVLTYFSTVANWKKTPSFDDLVTELYESQRELERAKQQLLQDERMKLLQPYIDHFRASHSAGGEAFLDTHISIVQLRIGGRPFFVSLVFLTNLFDVIDSTLALQKATINMAEKRGAKNKLWMPTGLRSIWKILSGKKGGQDLSRLGPSGEQNDGFERSDEIDDDLEDGGRTARAAGDGADNETPSDSTRSSFRRYSNDEEDDDDEGSDENGRRRTESGGASSSLGNGGARGDDEEKGQARSRASRRQREASKKDPRQREGKRYRRDPDALPPTSLLHKIGRAIGAIYYFAWSPTGVFALRNAIATFAVWIVSVLPSTAGYFYQHRGIWALIMAQTGLALHGGELVFSLATRLAGTVLGALVGMVIWYCSTGNGNGNPYGFAAAAAVGFVPLIFLRAFAPMVLLLPTIMFSVTVVLIVGYSWIDSHLQVLANSGIGVDVAWRRALLVLIGMGFAFTVMVLPRLTSTRSLVRTGFARSTRDINALWCLVIEKWLSSIKEDRQMDAAQGFRNVVYDQPNGGSAADPTARPQSASRKEDEDFWSSAVPDKQISAAIRGQFVASHTRLATLSQQIGLASIDLQLRGRWPKERYLELSSIHSMLLESLMQLYISVDALQVDSELGSAKLGVERPEQHREWRRRLVEGTGFLFPQFISEVCLTLDLLGKSLRSGERLSHCQFGLLENLARYGHITRMAADKQRQGGKSDDLVTFDTLKDPLFMRYVTATMSVVTLAAQLDRFREVVKDLVGQMPLPGFDRHKDVMEERTALLFK